MNHCFGLKVSRLAHCSASKNVGGGAAVCHALSEALCLMVMSSWKMHTPQQCQVLIGRGILIGSRLSICLSTLSCALKMMRNDPSSDDQ